jgi:hypothetical protein
MEELRCKQQEEQESSLTIGSECTRDLFMFFICLQSMRTILLIKETYNT